MKVHHGILLILLMLSLLGCKVDHHSRVKQSQLLGKLTTIDAVTRIDVGTCQDYRDKSKPSESLIKANEAMQALFPDLDFEGCKSEGMQSLAVYTTPMEIGSLPEGDTSYEPKGVALVRNKNGIVFFLVSDRIQTAVTDGRKQKKITLSVSVRFNNDTDQDVEISPYAVFVDGTPFAGLPSWKESLSVKARQSVTITLGDIAAEYAVAKGVVPVFRQ